MDTITDRKVVFLKIDDILPNRFQPRIKFDEQALNELAESIKEHGILSPITVRPLGNKYEIVAGERRYKASTMAGLTEIPAMVIKMDDKESAEIALIENVQRKDLTPIEEAISYKKIFDMNIGISQDMLAKKMGKSQSAIANKLRLLNLSDEVQEALLENKISERHARSLLRIKDKNIQNILLDKIINERLTVRRTDEEVINMLSNNKDIEILDFEDQNAPIKKENINNPLNRFESLYNLPKTQIIEDKEDEFIPNIPDVTSFDVPPFKEVEPLKQNLEDTMSLPKIHTSEELNNTNMIPKANPKINPGFLDIDKIKSEAVEINENKNKISLEELLKMPEKEEKENIIEPVNNNRFFTMVENDDENGNTNVHFESNSDLNKIDQTPKFNSENLDFNSKFIPQEPSLFERLQAKENEPVETNELSGFDNEIFNTSNKSKLEQDNKYNFDSLFSQNNPVDNNMGPQNIFGSEPIDSDIKLPTNDIIEDEEAKENLNDTFNFDNLFKQNNPVDNTDIPFNFNDSLLNSNLQANTDVKLEEIKPVPPLDFNEVENKVENQFDYTPIYDTEDEPVEKHDNSKYGAADLKTIINTIRKCAETIEKYGYIIDTEEFDFENMYQVIFKIEKKN